MHSRINVPVYLCQYVISKNLINPFRLFLYLKITNTSGVFALSNTTVERASETLNYKTEKTFHTNLKKLEDLRWISADGIRFYMRSFEYLINSLRLDYARGAEFVFNDLKTFRGFLGGVTYGYFSFVATVKRKKDRILGFKKGDPTQENLFFSPVAIRAVAISLNISITRANDLKQEAIKHDYIIVKKNIEITGDSYQKTYYLQKFDQDYGCIRNVKGKLAIVHPDLIISNLLFKRKKKNNIKRGL